MADFKVRHLILSVNRFINVANGLLISRQIALPLSLRAFTRAMIERNKMALEDNIHWRFCKRLLLSPAFQ